MNIDFDPTTMAPVHLRALSTFLLTIAGDEPAVAAPTRIAPHTTAQVHGTTSAPTLHGTMGAERRAEILAERGISPAQVDSMDEMAGLTHTAAPSAVPLPPAAPSPAAAEVFPTVHEVPQAGAVPPPPVPAPPVPAVPQPPAPSAAMPRAENGDLDKTGLPWDHRIHAGSKAKNADGTWRQRRNLPDGEYDRIEAELRHLMSLPGTAAPVSAVPPPPVASPADTATGADGSTATPTSVSAPAVPSPPVPAAPVSAVPLPPAPPAAVTGVSTPPPVPTIAAPAVDPANVEPRVGVFAKLMTTVTKNVTARRLTTAQVHAALERQGVPATSIGALSGNLVVAEMVLRELEVLPGVEVST